MLLAIIMLAGCAVPGLPSGKNSDTSFSIREVFDGLKSKIESLFGKEAEDTHAEAAKIRAEKIVPFSEMEYERPDIDILRGYIEDVEDALDEGKMKLPEIEELLDKCMDEYHNFSTMETLANIRNCLDLTDEYYADEYEWISEQDAVVSDLIDELYFACGGSKYAQKLEDDYFWEGFAEEYANEEDSIYTPEFVELSQKESNLVTKYRDIIADPVIVIDGQECSYNEAMETAEANVIESMNAYLENTNDFELYMKYYSDYMTYCDVLSAYYEQVGNSLAEIFIELVKTRNAMAEEAGYDSVEEMEYDHFFERDYTPEQAGEFIADVEEYIVPLKEKVMGEMDYEYDGEVDVSPDKLESCLETVVEVMGGHFAESYEFMTRYDLYDFSDNPNKTPMSFETYLDKYEAPYLLISPSDDIGDTMTAIHEFGHYNDSFVSYGAGETIDLAECFSQGLELLSLTMLEDEIGEDAVRYLGQSKVKDIVWTYIQQCAFAEFEREVYVLPESELTVENINRIAMDLGIRFGFMSEDSESFYSYYWVDIPHFFESPFYVISYPISCNIAMQFYALELDEEGSGIAKYNEMVEHESGDFLETVEEYKMDSPFEAGSVKEVASLIKKMCKKYR